MGNPISAGVVPLPPRFPPVRGLLAPGGAVGQAFSGLGTAVRGIGEALAPQPGEEVGGRSGFETGGQVLLGAGKGLVSPLVEQFRRRTVAGTTSSPESQAGFLPPNFPVVQPTNYEQRLGAMLGGLTGTELARPLEGGRAYTPEEAAAQLAMFGPMAPGMGLRAGGAPLGTLAEAGIRGIKPAAAEVAARAGQPRLALNILGKPQVAGAAPEAGVPKIPGKGVQPQRFYAQNQGGQFTEVPDAQLIKIPGFESVEFFVHKVPNTSQWAVTEGRTGLAMNFGKTRNDAIRATKEVLDRIGAERLTTVYLGEYKGAISPRYSAPTAPEVAQQAAAPLPGQAPLSEAQFDALIRARLATKAGIPLTREAPAALEAAAPAPRPAAPAAKEAWMMTKVEYVKERAARLQEGTEYRSRFTSEQLHRRSVEGALQNKEPVPANVLAEYPELAARARPAPAVTPAGTLPESRPIGTAYEAVKPTPAGGLLQKRQQVAEAIRKSTILTEEQKVARLALLEKQLAPGESLARPAPPPAVIPLTKIERQELSHLNRILYPSEKDALRRDALRSRAFLQPTRPAPPPAGERVAPPAPEVAPPRVAGVPPGTGGQLPPAGRQRIQPVAAYAPGAGAPPPTAPPPTATGAPPPLNSPLGRIQTMWKEGGKKPSFRERLPDFYLKAQEYLNDNFYGLRRLQTRVAKGTTIEAGGSRDLITHITLAPGAANAGAKRYAFAVNEMKDIAPNIMVDDVNTILWANHAKEVLAEKGAKRVVSGGLTSQELDTALTQLRDRLGPEGYSNAEQAADVMRKVYKAQRQRMVGRFITAEEAALWEAKYPWYNPMKYVEDALEQEAKGKSVRPFTQTSRGVYRLSDIGTLKAAQRPLDAAAEQLIRNEVLFQKDVTKQAIIDLLLADKVPGVKKITNIRPVAQVEGQPIFRPAWQDPPGTLSYWKDAKRQIYEVPEWVYWEAVTLNQTVSNPVSSLIGSLNGISKASFTSLSPVFTVANMMNDMLPALVRGGVLPNETARRLLLSFKGLETDPLMQAYNLTGALQARFYGKEAAEIARMAGASGGKVIGKGFDLRGATLEAIPNFGQKGEQASRQAIFERNLNKTLPGWKNMTAEEIAATPQARKAGADAVEGTINFSRGGYLFRSANPFVIFLNASMEGTKLPFRALGVLQPGQNSSRARWTLAGLGTGLAGLTAYNMSYPEYFDVPDRVRWGSVMIMLPSTKTDLQGKPVPRYLTIIPNTREWAAFFAPLTYGMEKAFKDSPTKFGQFAWAIIPQVSPVSQVPLPPTLEEVAEQAANYDFYTGTKIVSQGKQNLPVTEQTGPYVSPTVERVSQAAGLSPLRVQHTLQGLFGGAGQAVTSLLDLVAGVQNKQGLDLKAQYDQLPAGQRATWLNKRSAAEKSALKSAMGQAEQTIPVVSSIAGRFYRERGGQLEQNDWDSFNKTVEDTNKQFAATSRVNALGIRLGSVGDSIDLVPGVKGGSVDLTPAQRADYQRIMGEVVTPGIRELLPKIASTLPVETQKAEIQRWIGIFKDQAKDRFIAAHRAQLAAQLEGQPTPAAPTPTPVPSQMRTPVFPTRTPRRPLPRLDRSQRSLPRLGR